MNAAPPWNDILSRCATELSHASQDLSNIQTDLAECDLHVSPEQVTRIQKLDEVNQLIDVVFDLLTMFTHDEAGFETIKPQNIRDRILGVEAPPPTEDIVLF